MTAFFEKAVRRDYSARFDNAEEMLRAWRHLFLAAGRPEIDTDHAGPTPQFIAIDEARLDTLLSALGLSARGLNAIERMSVRTVHDLLRFPLIQVNRMRGVGSRTRKELTNVARRLAERFPEAAKTPKTTPAGDQRAEIPDEAARASVDELRRQLLPAGRTAQSRRDTDLAAALLGLRDHGPAVTWPTQSDVARALDVTPRGGQRGGRASAPALEQDLRADPAPARRRRDARGARERDDATGARRRHPRAPWLGAGGAAPLRVTPGRACAPAVEIERHLAAPRWIVRRVDGPAGVLLARDVIDDRGELRIDGPEAGRFRATTRYRPWPRRPVGRGRGQTGCSRSAAPAGRRAALSSRLELYPRGMAADRALRLALGALAGASTLTPEEIRRRVAGRYPDAAACRSGPISTRCSGTREASCAGNRTRPTVRAPTGRRSASS